MSTISNELISPIDNDEKIEKLGEILAPLENIGSKIEIEYNNNEIYSTSNKNDVLNSANKIVNIDTNKNINYFSEDGIVIVNHAETDDGVYLVLITNNEYTVNNVSTKYTAQDFSSLFFGKTGLIIFLVMLVFIIAILVFSFITSGTINKPLKKLAKGANEIANGNLDYIIDYESTNEIGETVNAFNHMTQELKASIIEKEKIEESRKEMIAGLAHDIRTPLTSAKGYVEGLLDGIANTPEKQERYLKTIYSSTVDMEKLTDELLTISKLELGTIDINLTPTNMNSFFDDCVDELSLKLEKCNFDFEYINNLQADDNCKIDSDRFARVINNIISNSIKYKRDNVKNKIVLTTQSYQKSIIISIADNGIGVDSENLPKIFDSFYRADKARSNVSDGSGIGLAICKQIVEMHGGRIWATGKENEGITIFISLDKIMENNNE